MTRSPARLLLVLMVGDALVVGLTSIAGFARHAELGSVDAQRIAATIVPFSLAWFAVAPWLGCYHEQRGVAWRGLWRPLLAAVLAAPLGAVLRGLWLNAAVIPIFAVVMASVLGGAMVIWRGIAGILLRRGTRAAG